MGKLAIFAGLFASLASVFSKLAFDSKTPISFLCFKSKDDFCEQVRMIEISHDSCRQLSSSSYIFLQVILVSRIVCFSLVILSNVGMWLMFTKALQEHSTAAQPAVINSACNFLFSVSLFYVWKKITLHCTGATACKCNNTHQS